MYDNTDGDGQPLNRGYNATRNRRKALFTLLGICEGLLADNQLTRDEVVFLDVWLKENAELRDDPDYIDLVDAVQDILGDGLITEEELTDLQELLQTLVDFRSDEALSSERGEMEFLLGFLRGVAADQELNEYEILALRAWLRNTMLSNDKWPASVLLKRIRQIVADKRIEDAEAADLLDTITDIVGDGLQNGIASGLSTSLPVDPVNTVDFTGRSFCITGKLASGPRHRCEMAISSRGSIPQSSVNKTLDYLVIGTLASRDWAQSSYGTKIERAMELRDQGNRLLIISEEVLYRFL